MERIDIKNGMKRGLTSSALITVLAFTGLAQAEGTAREGDVKGQTGKAQPSEQPNRAPALSGLNREQVKDVQRELASRGLYQGSIDGVPGAKTEAALRNFQTQQGLTVGSLNAPTRDALGIDWSQEPARASAAAPIQQKDAQRQNVSGSEAQHAQKQPVRGTDEARTDARVAQPAVQHQGGSRPRDRWHTAELAQHGPGEAGATTAASRRLLPGRDRRRGRPADAHCPEAILPEASATRGPGYGQPGGAADVRSEVIADWVHANRACIRSTGGGQRSTQSIAGCRAAVRDAAFEGAAARRTAIAGPG